MQQIPAQIPTNQINVTLNNIVNMQTNNAFMGQPQNMMGITIRSEESGRMTQVNFNFTDA